MVNLKYNNRTYVINVYTTKWGNRICIRNEKDNSGIELYTYCDEYSPECYITDLFVEESKRRQRYGTDLLAISEQIAKYLGYENLKLYAEDDTWLCDWYKDIGYGLTEIIRDAKQYQVLEKILAYNHNNDNKNEKINSETLAKIKEEITKLDKTND